MLFVEAPQTREELARIARRWAAARRCWPTWSRAARRRSCRRRAGGARLRAGDLSRRHRARAGEGAGEFYALAGARTAPPTPFRDAHARLRRAQRAARHARRCSRSAGAIPGKPRPGAERTASDERARSRHARGAQGPARADRRRDGRDALPLGVQPDHRRGARRLPRPLPRRDRRHAGAGHVRPADLRRRHGLRGEGRDRQGRRATAVSSRATPIIFNDPYDGGTHLNDFRLVRPLFRDGKRVLLARLGRPLARRRRQRARQLQRRARPRASRKACASRR